MRMRQATKNRRAPVLVEKGLPADWALGGAAAGLDFEEALDEGYGGGGYAGDAAGLAEGQGADAV